mgnify:FL=1
MKRVFNQNKKSRIWEIDFLRGLPIIGLVLYHLGYDFIMLPYVFSNFYAMGNKGLQKFCYRVSLIMDSRLVDSLVPVFAGTFLLICGISSSFSKNNIIRGLRIFAFGMLITLVTSIASYIIKEDMIICFGILHCMGLTITIYGILQWICRKLNIYIPDYVPFMVGLLIISIGMFIGNKGSFAYPIFNIKNLGKIILGTIGSSTDWFPIFPWSGVIVAGISFGKWIYPEDKKQSLIPNMEFKVLKPISFIGRHTLLIYALHQVIFISIFAMVLLPMGYKI